MFAHVIIAAAVLGISGEEQEALDALIASRQAARAARLEAQAGETEGRMLVFSARQAHEARQRKSARQMRLVAAKSSGRQYGPVDRMSMLRAAAISEAYRRQFSQAGYMALPSYYRR